MTHAIRGLWPALATAFTASGAVDTARTLAQARRMLAAGSDGITLFGTTGEGPALTVAERQALLEAALADGVRPEQLIVCTTACALGDAVTLGRHAIALGCTRQLTMPAFYFNHPRDVGVVDAVTQLVRGIDNDALRLLLYQFPSLSNVAFSHASIAALAEAHPGVVVGVKDSTGDRPHTLALVRAFPQLGVLVGAEPDVAPTMLAGAAGSVNGLANLAPRLMRRVVDRPAEVSADDQALMQGLLQLLELKPDMPFVSAYKTALAEQLGDDGWLHVRAPLAPLDNTEAQAIRAAYRALGRDLASL
ncbi:dihydrodipicolinate synthase family protein [Pseudorhodoferax sp.]|uniref:dihydrodipicolinate synthase family protein n=1 Tax=Pseudorhodoferax sp. TaxID=1993553 RepID=UPI002DD64AC7|nr:dihydrodipicolinate synthase family protein [Pseudorhodoferax sp.]